MKFYDFKMAPSPRRARIFMAEKGLEIPTVQVDLATEEQLGDAFKALNPWLTVPVLELDNGVTLSEVCAVCRYMEEIQPDPPLYGVDPEDKAVVAMWDHRCEMDGILAVSEAFRNSHPNYAKRALTGQVNVDAIPAVGERGLARIDRFFDMLNRRLGESEYMAGARFSVADITALVAVDFSRVVKKRLGDEHPNAKRWHEQVSARPSASA